MKKIRLKAMAKINLGLDVVRKREDGYHEVRMIMQTIRMYDQIELEPTEAPGIRVSTNLNYLPTNEDNLVYKAAKLLMDEFDVKKGLNIGLRKFIPVAAGMAVGQVDYYVGEDLIASFPVTASETVGKWDLEFCVKTLLNGFLFCYNG